MEDRESNTTAQRRDAESLFAYMLRYKWAYAGGLACLVVVDIAELYIPQIIGEVTDGLEAGTMDMTGVTGMVLRMILLAAVIALMRLGWRVLLMGTARKIERNLRSDLFTRLSTLSERFYQQHKTGDLMAHFTNDMEAIRLAVGSAVLSVFDAVFMTFVVVARMIWYVDLKLTLLAMIPLLFILFGGYAYGTSMNRRYGRKQAAFSRLTDQVEESISGVRVVKAFVQERWEREAFDEVSRDNREANLDVVRLKALMLPMLEGMIGLSSTVTLFYGGWLVYRGGISLGRFIAFNSYITMLVWPMIAAGDAITTVSQGYASWKRIRSLLNERPEIHDDDHTDLSITKTGGSIRFEHLSFRYAQELPLVLRDFTAEIPAGSMVGILGRTGCGKSTLVNLLLRMYDTEPGMIAVGGYDLRSIPISVLRGSIACVPQENFLFSDTLQSNIAFGVRTADQLPSPEKSRLRIFTSRREVQEEAAGQDPGVLSRQVDEAIGDLDAVTAASKAACLHENVLEFPHQYSTVVGERGVTVSGGQKQRAAIARALMKDAEILILDDSLSAVDTDTERQILENLRSLRAGKTTILIAHRVSTVQSADRILVLEDGICAESGTHAQLLSLGGRYARLYEQQQLELQLQAKKEAFHAQD